MPARRRTEFPPSLRSAANLRATRGRPPRPGTKLYEAAAAGILTDANTRKGSRGRQAVDAVAYRTRRAARPTTTAREALGHAPPGSEAPRASFFAKREEGGDIQLLVNVVVRRADVSRIAKHDSALRRTASGRYEPGAFRRRFGRFRPVVVLEPEEWAGRWVLVADVDADQAAALVGLGRDEGVEDWIDSGRSRPLPRRRRSA